eukprot:CAMPEP_0197233170 /NCGR_PEP_ID=MMETSP1429-20130617/1317_1 /TAXON_ID=49237 /ORGANISM="Chaetoceros  sp., Strain UNC1202" /LENGTH=172 /DNA_ID=CAMNT_0042691381 /DNA_START=19 /DNA_END=537 /DNA_ORIENTATION=-
MTDTNNKINQGMGRIARELRSNYATFPLKRKAWLDPNAQIDTGAPAFIPHAKDSNKNVTPTFKDDYVWTPGSCGFGYYHLLTRDAYVGLHVRLRKNPPPIEWCSCCLPSNSRTGQLANDYEDAVSIVYNRSIASRPDDFLAGKEAIAIARGEARTAYNMSQDVQLIVMMAST